MLGSVEQDGFVARSIIAIVTTLRTDGSPAASMVSFARRRDQLFFTTTLTRLKGRSLARDPRCGLTVVNPHEPWSFVSIEGRVVIHRDNPAELRELILDSVGHPDYPWTRDEVEAMATAPDRAIFEMTPDRVSGVVMPL